jgi:hypothetical protein
MENWRVQSMILIATLLVAFCAPAAAQTAGQNLPPAPIKEKPIPANTRPMPFSLGGPDAEQVHSIEFRDVDKMTEKDRELAANAESSIGELAGYAGLEFNQGAWSYRQVICLALPKHIFLRFIRNNGTRDVSIFTASIPRGEEGRVRIIPIQLRGYSLFSPAPINALTISAFNHIRAEENPDHAPVPDWIGTGLCYAALAGAKPELAVPTASLEKENSLVAVTASLQIPNGGGAVISFSDVAAVPRPMEWEMTFDGKGRLLKASHSTAPLLSVSIPRQPGDQSVAPVAIRQPALVTRPIPPEPGAQTVQLNAVTQTVQTPIPASTTNPNEVPPHSIPQT